MKFLKAGITAIQARWENATDRFERLPQRQKNLFIFAISFFAVVLIIFTILRPLQQSVLKVDKQIKMKEKLAAKNIQEMAQKPQVSSVYFKLLSTIEMPPGGDEAIRSSILHDIEFSARSNNISLTEIKPQVSSLHENFTEFFMNTQAEGTTSQLVLFLGDLIKANTLYYIDTLRISRHPEVVNKIKATVSIGRSALTSSPDNLAPQKKI